MKFLIPPSEGKLSNSTTKTFFENTDFIYLKQVDEILKILKNLKSDDLKKVYGTKIDKAILIHKQNLNIKKEYCSPAIDRYTGTVYSNIDFGSFNKKEKDFFNQHFLIFSGLFGMVKPLTLIPNYKLKMNVLQLYNKWNPILTKELDKEDMIFDLLPLIHKKAYSKKAYSKNINFIIYSNGKKVPAGHFGKVVKGKFIKFICKNQITDINDFSYFEYDGFKWHYDIFLKSKKLHP